MMAAALAVAAGVALVVSLRAPGEPVEASPAAKTASAEAASGLDSYEKFEEEPRETVPRTETKEPESETKEPESKAKEPEKEPKPPKRQPGPRSEPRQASLPAETPNGPAPRPGELGDTDRRFAPDPGAALTLTIPSLGVYGAPIYDSDSAQALEAGVGHVPGTSMPWDAGEQRNVYLAAHRLGYPGTGSRLLFYELDKLRHGDAVIIKGRGETYRYRVTYSRVVNPNDSWVMGKVRGRDMVTLQTCTPIPTFEKRLIVRAYRI